MIMVTVSDNFPYYGRNMSMIVSIIRNKILNYKKGKEKTVNKGNSLKESKFFGFGSKL